MSIGNLRDDGNQSKNFPWQLKMLLGQQCACDQLTAINANTDDIEFLLTAILTTLQASTEYEAKFVLDTCDSDKVYLEVRVWNPDTSTWGPITYYLPGSDTAVIPVGASTPGCLQYADPSAVLALILGAIQASNIILQDIETNTGDTVTELQSLLALVATLETITVNQGTSPWVVSLPTGTNTSFYDRILGAVLIVPAGAISLSVQNIGNDNINIVTDSSPATVIDPGISLTFDAQEGKTLGAYTFTNSTASSLYIVTQIR